ncbi:biopolymer transporter ExbD [Candidatus Igneacidithiobacillus taiwanensis]|uniref:ExbD/TolR family protein n=1 Tax=Candidatus Igneacidithiobacillus taiwanensis TaxID=1945924 RepID=UPI00289AA7A2|nr:biopolymer transporter ExbD [Candidatus Igneacidithiobacillus taiwanensis]
MERRYFERRKGRVEIIPMIDIMLFLLVFFIMITIQMIPDQGLNLQLPQSSEAKQLPRPHMTINIQEDGTVVVKNHHYDLAGLENLIRQDGNPGKTVVTIAADKAVPYQKFINVMDACQKAGANDIGLAAKAS